MSKYTLIGAVYHCIRMTYARFEDETKNNNTQLQLTKVTSYGGKALWFCKKCMMEVRVAEEVRGTTRESDYTIYWHYLNGECGHTLEDWSY
jgi:hypothetical protein